MSTRAQDFRVPEVVPDQVQEAQYQNEWADHYGIMVGGVKESPWNGIGENAIGHHLITRRVWMPFTRLRVGKRPEFEGALDMPANSVQLDWSVNPERLGMKSPRQCAGDVLAAFGSQGYCVPGVLVGHAKPQALCDKVWPREVRDEFRLYQHIEYFENFQTADEQEAKLAESLLAACYLARDYIQEYVRTIKTEIESKVGLKNLNEPLKELFHEINEPLPEQKTALVAAEMGRAIVGANQNDGRKDDAMIGALNAIAAGQTQLAGRLDRLEARDSEPQAVQSGNTQEEATVTETSNTQPRRGPGRPRLSPNTEE